MVVGKWFAETGILAAALNLSVWDAERAAGRRRFVVQEIACGWV